MKSKITFLFVFFSVLFVNAQVEFEDHLIIDSSSYVQSPNAVFSADLDGDGDMDVLTSSYFGSKFVWLENLDGTGGDFILHTISITVSAPWGVCAADLDGDGDMDAIVASLSGNTVSWYENTDGAGNFVLKQSMYALKANFVTAADMDNDNDLDLVWSTRVEGEMKWIKNTDGLGTFGITTNIENNVYAIEGFYPADIDGDGDMDIVSSYFIGNGGSEGVTWYKNNGFGSFGSKIIISSAVEDVTSVYAGDIDGDGDMDVVSASQSDDKIAWYENLDGLGTFGAQQVVSVTANNPMVVRLKDVDDDGDLDIIFGSNEDKKIGWLQNSDGQGNFSPEIVIASHSGDIRDIYFNDMDADGDLDFLTATNIDNNIKLFKNTDGAGTFTPTIITKYIDGGRTVLAEDIDGDGDKDIIAASYWDSKISWYENKDGQGDFYNAQRIVSDISGTGITFIDAGDVNGDGFPDIVGAYLLQNKIVLFKNNGSGSFDGPQILDSDLYNAYRVYFVDIDSDGDLDVIGSGHGKITLYKNLDGQGTFGPVQIIDFINNSSFFALDFGDLDGDGDMDMSTAGSGLSYYLNLDGQGAFGASHVLESYPYTGAGTKIADFDNDGDNDIVFTGDADIDENFVGWYENTNGLANFGSMHIITTIISNATDVVVGDFDNDGDMDVASSNTGTTGGVAWYTNSDGQGNFANTQQIISQNSTSPNNLCATDIDGNGTIDILSITEYDDKLVWHKNLGIPTSNSISGSVRFDLLGDGCTETDAVLSGLMIVATDSLTTNATFSQENGHFQLYTTQDGTVTTKITSQLPNYYTASPLAYESNFTSLGNADEVNFCVQPVASINDLTVSFYPVNNAPRPGFDTSYRIVYKNVGTTQLSGSVVFEFDGAKLNFLNASETVASQTATALTFDFANLNPFETKTIDLHFNVFAPPVTNINDLLTATATITPVTEDYSGSDNVFSETQIVIGSYDPNDIACLEGDQVLMENADKYLHYLIRFQNTGTASAINVRVDHQLDDKLDWTTMQLETLSHPGQVAIRNGSEVSFTFNNIELPDSTSDEPGSHGFIAYKIKPKSDVLLGDIISAVAEIYFDFNPPIVTNIATTEFVNVLNIEESDVAKISIYPNPTKGILNIVTTSEIASISVYNTLGQLVLSAKDISMIDLSALRQGAYVLKVTDRNGRSHNQKVIKK